MGKIIKMKKTKQVSFIQGIKNKNIIGASFGI